MIFLEPRQQQNLYAASLRQCAYINLDDSVIQIWKHLVGRGLNSILPGDLGRIIERLRYQASGQHMPGAILHSQLQAFLRQEIWRELEKLTGGLEFTPSRLPEWADALYYICDFLGIGSVDTFHWGALDDFAASDDSFAESEDLLSAGTGIEDFLIHNSRSLQQSRRDKRQFNFTERIRFLHPEIIEDSFIHAVHGYWEVRHIELREKLGTLPPVEENNSNDMMFAEPEFQTFGGYNDIELRGEGNFSALLSSELVYIEDGSALDYFDIRYIENQLLYYKKDEGLNRKLRRLVKLDFRDIDLILPGHIGRYMAWVEYLMLITHDLFSKDKLKIVLLLSSLDNRYISSMRQLLYLRLQILRPDYQWNIVFSQTEDNDIDQWKKCSVLAGSEGTKNETCFALLRPESRMGLKQQSPAYQIRRATAALAEIEAYFRGDHNG